MGSVYHIYMWASKEFFTFAGDQSALLVGIVIGSVFLFLTLTVYVVSLVVLCTCMKK